jgi:hypothetical protein
MKRFLIFGVLWPLLFLVFLSGFTDPSALNRVSIWMNLKITYAWMVIPALLLGVFDLLFVETRYGLVWIPAFAGVVGLAFSHSIEGVLMAAIPTLACGWLTGLVESRCEKQNVE